MYWQIISIQQKINIHLPYYKNSHSITPILRNIILTKSILLLESLRGIHHCLYKSFLIRIKKLSVFLRSLISCRNFHMLCSSCIQNILDALLSQIISLLINTEKLNYATLPTHMQSIKKQDGKILKHLQITLTIHQNYKSTTNSHIQNFLLLISQLEHKLILKMILKRVHNIKSVMCLVQEWYFIVYYWTSTHFIVSLFSSRYQK